MEFKVAYSARIDDPEPDKRYRFWVTLQRTDRPIIRKYPCLRCMTQLPQIELVNVEPLVVSDLFDVTEVDRAGVGIRCTGKYYDEELGHLINCRAWHYFSLGGTQ